MKKTIIICFAGLFALTLSAQGPGGGRGFGLPRAQMGARLSSGPVTGAPYSATETFTSQQTLANGTQISHAETSNVARDSDGRTCTVTTVTPPASSGKQPFTETTIVDPVGGYRYMLNSSTMTAIQMPLPKAPTSTTSGTATPPPTRTGGGQATTTDLGGRTVNGIAETGTQTTRTIPAGAIGNSQPIQIVRIVWVSTALQVPVETKTSDPRRGTTGMELANISQGAFPSWAVFAVPSGYAIKTGGGRFGGQFMRGNARPGWNQQ
jgi:hypothetical protein